MDKLEQIQDKVFREKIKEIVDNSSEHDIPLYIEDYERIIDIINFKIDEIEDIDDLEGKEELIKEANLMISDTQLGIDILKELDD